MKTIKRPDGSLIVVENTHTQENLQKVFNVDGWYFFIESEVENYLFKNENGEVKFITSGSYIGFNNKNKDYFHLLSKYGGRMIKRSEVEKMVKMLSFI